MRRRARIHGAGTAGYAVARARALSARHAMRRPGRISAGHAADGTASRAGRKAGTCCMCGVTVTEPAGDVPDWDIADRMRKALRTADIGVGEMADYLGVSRTSVSNWINGRVEPSFQAVRLCAIRTGVDLQRVLGRTL